LSQKGSVGTGVGAEEGDGVGNGDGAGVGIAVGADVGTAVGTAVGTDVGIPVGTDVGNAVGTDVGTADGTGVGRLVGTAVGTADGTAVGTELGAKEMVGPGVGRAEGAGVGTDVGTGEIVGTAVGILVGIWVVSMFEKYRTFPPLVPTIQSTSPSSSQSPQQDAVRGSEAVAWSASSPYTRWYFGFPNVPSFRKYRSVCLVPSPIKQSISPSSSKSIQSGVALDPALTEGKKFSVTRVKSGYCAVPSFRKYATSPLRVPIRQSMSPSSSISKHSGDASSSSSSYSAGQGIVSLPAM